ncbi:type II toxin-antitoxin system RelE/ParE family toxin [Thermodesulfovibrionales bacterium]|nr:type II toxin-antitoxin system RelE/ParE family toxin [Thermodesulfovibrionales bacterium]MCL0040429.1 type II toxin-antitoxin system RelE/ParE family toxin [Thermodesulfovibrionales bacterium]MCL0067271.1 type II toxin-antitoxin system RelE/ParE family toxin [Thermodesulfovibrionales bacterium]MCL0083832.1 type II toxin-antitoxin system RelE/ParE family toxin [Thermodesulfovibrionales bacterium]
MGKYKIEFSKKAARHYKKLPANYKTLVDIIFTKFSNGIPVDIKPIRGEENTFRIRVGKYRILLTIIEDIILIIRIGSRGDIYQQ